MNAHKVSIWLCTHTSWDHKVINLLNVNFVLFLPQFKASNFSISILISTYGSNPQHLWLVNFSSLCHEVCYADEVMTVLFKKREKGHKPLNTSSNSLPPKTLLPIVSPVLDHSKKANWIYIEKFVNEKEVKKYCFPKWSWTLVS